MHKLSLLIGLLFFVCTGYGQNRDTIPLPDTTRTDTIESGIVVIDSARQDTVIQDTVQEETRAERRARRREEKEREKYYYKDILKDSARLEIERLSRVAWKRSLIVPGWGQYTNGGVWWIKVPVIYGGFVASALVFDYWQWYYKMLVDESDCRDGDGQGSSGSLGMNSNWTVQGLVQVKGYVSRNRDVNIVITFGWYGVIVVEA